MNSSLLPPGSSALERRLAQACSGISDLNVPLRDLWNPWKCPAKFLPYLAWAFSVDRWEETWSETEKRQAVSDAFWIHQRKGTVAALRRVVETQGFAFAIQEWFDVDDRPGTFHLEIDVNETGATDKSLNELERLINETKPISRTVSKMNILSRTDGPTSIGAAVCCGDIITVYPGQYQPEPGVTYNGQIHFDSNYYFVGDE
ncbi:TPA: phage tail protein I [Klebsiella pneumoniae]|nr:phage tail protein I [Klebsiella pneumoniae]